MSELERQQHIFNLIALERMNQDELFAEDGSIQNDPFLWLAVLTEEVGEVAREVTGQTPLDRYTPQPNGLHKELVQVAAVCTAWLESIEREAEMRLAEVMAEHAAAGEPG